MPTTFLAQCLEMFEFNLPVTIVAGLESGKIIYANAAFEKQLGIDRDVALGQTMVSLGLLPDEKYEAFESKILAQGSMGGLPIQVKTPRGETVKFLLSANLLVSEGQRFLRSYLIDITDLQPSEERADQLALELRAAHQELVLQNVAREKVETESLRLQLEQLSQNGQKDRRLAEQAYLNDEQERQNVAAELRVTKYLREWIESSLNPLITVNLEGKITDLNKIAMSITGLTRETLVGSDFFERFTEPEKARELHQEVLAKGFIRSLPFTLRGTGGKLIDVLVHGSVYKDDEGQAVGIIVVTHSISDYKRLAVSLENGPHEISGYKMALDESSILAITDRNGVIKYVNDNFCKISKYNKEELIGQDHRVMNSRYHSSAFMRNLWDTIRAGKIWTGEIKNKAKDGTFYWVHTTIIPFLDDAGEVCQYIGIRSDITSKKLIRQYSMSLMEASPDPLVTITLEGKINAVNQAIIQVTGQSREALSGTDFKDYFTDPERASEVYRDVFSKGLVTDYPLKMMASKPIDVLLNGSVYRDEVGHVVGAVFIARDITEQNRAQRELTDALIFAESATRLAEHAQAQAEIATITATNAMKAKQQFLSNMSHEIRTPMNAIIGFTKVVLKTELSAKQREYLSAIKISGEALIVLLNDILDLAKVDAGKMTFEKAPFKLAASVSALIHLFEMRIQEKNLELIINYDRNIPETLLGDAVRLHQIILNLMSNAVKFTSHGKIVVSVSLVQDLNEEVRIAFAFSDTGIGIDRSQIAHIFENFQQASSSTSRLFGGTGLGLAIVKQLVELQGGTIAVTSQVDIGSTFTFELTFGKTEAEAKEESSPSSPEEDPQHLKVLVVEDMPLNQLLMRTLLDDFGFEPDIAANGRIAVEKMQSKTYDIVLMDLQMPEMNGFEATAYIRDELHSSIPIIALTADVTTVDLAKCKAVGMNDYLAKPVDERLLYSKIVSLVAKASTARPKLAQVRVRCIDLGSLTMRTKANPQLMVEMIMLYLDQTPLLVAAMKQGLLAQDWQGLYAAVHKMIPSFSIMGIDAEFERIAKKVQEHARVRQEEAEGIPEMVLQLENICLQACEELQEELNIMKTTKR